MKKTFDFKPTHLKKLSFEVNKLAEKKEKEQKKIFNKIKKIFNHSLHANKTSWSKSTLYFTNYDDI